MDLGITGKVAIVTGGASGIGAATAQLLAQEGACVAVWDLHPHAPEGVSLVQSVDVCDMDQVTAAWQLAGERLGAVEIVVHAAAIGSGYYGFPYTRSDRPDNQRRWRLCDALVTPVESNVTLPVLPSVRSSV